MSAFAKTSRPCSPFCMQPMSLTTGVETLGDSKSLTRPLKCQREIPALYSLTPEHQAKRKKSIKPERNHVGPERAYCIAQI